MQVNVQIVIKSSEYGEFRGEKHTVSLEQHANIVALSKTFYQSGFEMTLENGDFVVIPPDVIKKSVLLVEIFNQKE